MEALEVPIDPRTACTRPMITNEMKAECIGEFEFEIEDACSACAFHGSQDDCEVCGGEVDFSRTVTVPWDTCKEIYKRMALVAARYRPQS